MSDQVQLNNRNKGLTVKDLIVTGVFSALIFICISLSGGIFAVMPALTFYYPVGAALLAGPVFLLMSAKVPKRGPVIIAGLLIAVFVFATGMHWAMAVGYITGGIIADVVAGMKGYKSKKTNIVSYILFCLGGTGSYLAYFISPESWVSAMLEKGTPQEYLDTMLASAGWWVLVTMLVGTVLVAWLSGFVGSKLLKKQFEKAGITA